NTEGFTSRKPGRGAAARRFASVTVSPTLAAESSLMPAITKPTSPAESSSTTVDFGVNCPTWPTGAGVPVAVGRMLRMATGGPSPVAQGGQVAPQSAVAGAAEGGGGGCGRGGTQEGSAGKGGGTE